MEPKIELHVAVNHLDAVEAVIRAGADAVSLGGRLKLKQGEIEDGYFDREQIKVAVELAHAQNAKLYVVVDDLLSDEELQIVPDYLTFLEGIGIDGMIIRDLALLDLTQKEDPGFKIQVSALMNVCNQETLRYLQDRGVERVEFSPEMSLEQITQYAQETEIEMELLLFGQRWYTQSGLIHKGMPFELPGDDLNGGGANFKPLPTGNLHIYQQMQALLQAGICALKIDGRKWNTEIVQGLVTQYRQELDRYQAGKAGFNTPDEKAAQDSLQQQFLQMSTSYALEELEQPGTQSGGLMIETCWNKEITEEDTRLIQDQLRAGVKAGNQEKDVARITVAVSTFEHFLTVIQTRVDRILIGGDLPSGQRWSYEQIAMAIKLGYEFNTEVIYRTPGWMTEQEMTSLKDFFDAFNPYHLRIMTGDIGVVEATYGADISFTLFGDYGLNVCNSQIYKYLKRQAFDSAIISLESGVNEVCSIGGNRIIEVEMLVQGSVPGMVCGNHLALMPVLGELAQNGVNNFRIEGHCYPLETLVEIIQLYRKVIRFDYDPDVVEDAFAQLQRICQVPFTYGALVPN